MYTTVKMLPQHLQAALLRVNYRRPDIEIAPAETVCVLDAGADGRQAFFFPFSLAPAPGCGAVVWGSWGGPNMFQTRQPDADNREHPIPPGCGVVKGSYGGPGRTFARLYLHPASLAPLLPALPTLTERQNQILQLWKQLSSAGRAYEFDRHAGLRPSGTELAELVGLGLLSQNKAGAVAITTAGKNAVRGRYL